MKSLPPSNQPDSMNVYGSYIDDSYVGDFSGEVNPDMIIETSQQDENNFWENETKLDGVLEFSFDSFGPESMLFPRNGDGGDGSDGDRSSKSIGNNSVLKDFDNDLASTITSTSEKTDFSFDQFSSNGDIPQKAAMANNIDSISRDTSSPSGSESFRRNSSLTLSQRRRIRPKLKIEQIFNDEPNTNGNVDQNGDFHDQDKTPQDSPTEGINGDVHFNGGTDLKEESISTNGSLTREELEGSLLRQGSLRRKKITVNRELFNNDDFIAEDEPPHFQDERLSYKQSDSSSNQTPNLLKVQEEANESQSSPEPSAANDLGFTEIDNQVIQPFKKVISHGGYLNENFDSLNHQNGSSTDPGPAIIIFSACYLPERSRKDYDYVMDNLFMYVLTTLHELVADEYILIYFHNAGCSGVSSNNMPTFSWLKRCYTMIDRKLRKNLRSLFLVHPTFWLKTFVIMTKPFISSKFAKKLRFVSTLVELNNIVPIDSTVIPSPVKQTEEERLARLKKKGSRP